MFYRLHLGFCIFLTALLLHFTPHISTVFAINKNQPIATDSRIKTFVYSPNEVFPIILHYGYQTSIEFAQNEKIQTYSLGNSYAWQFNSTGRTLFIKPLEENISTNMILLTNKRRYYFELQSKMLSEATDQDLVYAIRFFYPDNDEDVVAPNIITEQEQEFETIPAIKPYNFSYTITTKSKNAPTAVFDNGNNTFLQYENNIPIIPTIRILRGKRNIEIIPHRIGNYLVINEISDKIELKQGREIIKIQKTTK
jgi:type IV secretion system protein VirB9